MSIRNKNEKVTNNSRKVLRQLTERYAQLHYDGAPAAYEDPADYVRVGRGWGGLKGAVIA